LKARVQHESARRRLFPIEGLSLDFFDRALPVVNNNIAVCSPWRTSVCRLLMSALFKVNFVMR
ncbi:hypothetical protein ACIMOX_25575, partial [Escherichia coli]